MYISIPILIVILLIYLMLFFKKKNRKKYYSPFKTTISVLIFLYAMFLSFIFQSIQTKYSFFIILGLFFSIWGDLFLSLEEKYFIFGMISFFITHVFYILAFISINYHQNTFILTGLIIISLVTYFNMFKNLNNLKVPVLFYTIIITIMVYFSIMIFLNRLTNFNFRILILSGSLLFFISDTILSINKFLFKIKYRDYLVGYTYFIGQLLIACSIFYF